MEGWHVCGTKDMLFYSKHPVAKVPTSRDGNQYTHHNIAGTPLSSSMRERVFCAGRVVAGRRRARANKQ